MSDIFYAIVTLYFLTVINYLIANSNQSSIMHVGVLIGTDRPEFIRIIHRTCIHKTLEFEDDIIHN